MTTISMFSICLLAWLLLGLYVGIKTVWVEDKMSDKKLEELREKIEASDMNTNHPAFPIAWDIMSNKKKMIALFTLLGGISMAMYIKAKYDKAKAFITKKRGK